MSGRARRGISGQNVLATTVSNPGAFNQVYSVANGRRTTLNELSTLRSGSGGGLTRRCLSSSRFTGDFRAGDIRHSVAGISKAQQLLG